MTLIVAGVLVAVVALVCALEDRRWLLVSALGVAMAVVSGVKAPRAVFEMQSSTPLVAFSNVNGIEGRWWLFGGSLNSTKEYTYLVEDGEGFVHQRTLYVHYCRVKETDGRPRLEQWGWTTTHWNNTQPSNGPSTPRYDFYIPKGSIWRGYELDIRAERDD